jgi:carbon-monoxide dehydrogenase medium subunit
MLLPKFDFHEPATVAEACQAMAEYKEKAKALAGGTDLIVNMKKKLIAPPHIVAISRIEEITGLKVSPRLLRIGSCFTIANIAASEAIAKKWSALCAGAKALGSPQIRNLATIGGNIASASSAADMPPSLIAYDAKVVLTKESGQRVVSMDHFFLGSKLADIAPDEIIMEIQIEEPPPYSGAGYLALGIRSAQDIKIVNVASFITLDGSGGIIKNARIVMGCVGPTPLRASSAERLLVGEKPTEALFAKAAEAAIETASPRGAAYSRASAKYKKEMVGVLTRRTLGIALKEATQQG